MKEIKDLDSEVARALYMLGESKEFMVWLNASRNEILDSIDAPPPVDTQVREFNCGKSRQILDFIETITSIRKRMDKMLSKAF